MCKVCIASLNIRVASNAEENEQGIREPRILSFLERKGPNSVGMQECCAFWGERLNEKMEEIGYCCAQEVPSDPNTFKNHIWYRTDTTELIDSGIYWLSETPEEPSKGYGSQYYISVSWALLKLKGQEAEYVHINTHLDYSDEAIRRAELDVLLPVVEKFITGGYAVVLTGDFNSREESCIYEHLAALLSDARKTAKKSTELNTFNGYQDRNQQYGYEVPESKYDRIDFCFHGDRVQIGQFQVIDKWEGGYMSDHNALLVDAVICNTN